MAPVVVDWSKVYEFADAAAFEAWLAENHDKADEAWILIHKVKSGRPTITPKEAIDVVLCWGWIDAIRKSHDEQSFLQRYTRRGKKSLWSQVNVENIARLESEGRMTSHGRVHVEAAKADGRWDAAYRIKYNEVPEDLLAAIASEPEAQALFDRLTSQNRFALSLRVNSLKTPAGREKKIRDFVAMLKRGDTIYPQGKA
jgi:uncharacterized protein YdeI (YjbR/CyaY-like superfamily)